MNLNGKKIVLTGASSGIGKEILKELKGYHVQIIAVARNIDTIPKIKNKVIPFSCDVSQEDEVDNLFEFALNKMGRIDIFIANAGFAYCEKLSKPSWKHIEHIFHTNVFSPIYSLEKMRVLNKNRKYTMVIMCSAVSEVPLPGYALYCATKHAIDGFGQVIQYEANNDETISLVYPIATRTNFFQRASKKALVPWPVQSPNKVATNIIKGIKEEKRFIYPSRLYIVSRTLNRICPLVNYVYAKINRYKFDIWLQGRENKL